MMVSTVVQSTMLSSDKSPRDDDEGDSDGDGDDWCTSMRWSLASGVRR